MQPNLEIMAQYALGGEGIIDAFDAEKGKKYWCLECKAPAKVRMGRYMPHFYHCRASPGCHLYSKSEDHLLLQLQLQKFLPQGEVEIEKPFLEINRVADLCWSREKIIFEIQCSPLELGEAQSRVLNYRQMDCDVIWLLDDRIFNRRLVRPAESWMRERGTYYVKFQRNQLFSLYYDQFDIVIDSKRLKKGAPLKLDFRFPRRILIRQWPSELPSCIARRIPESTRYFREDLLDRAIRSSLYPNYAFSISRWHFLENELMQNRPSFLKKIFFYLKNQYEKFILFLIDRINT